jgi:hypothetical protein
MAGRGKLGLGSNPAKGELGWQGEGGGEWEGTGTHSFEGLAGLREVGKGVAGGDSSGGGVVVRGSRATARERRKGVGNQLQEFRGQLFIGKRR